MEVIKKIRELERSFPRDVEQMSEANASNHTLYIYCLAYYLMIELYR